MRANWGGGGDHRFTPVVIGPSTSSCKERITHRGRMQTTIENPFQTCDSRSCLWQAWKEESPDLDLSKRPYSCDILRKAEYKATSLLHILVL